MAEDWSRLASAAQPGGEAQSVRATLEWPFSGAAGLCCQSARVQGLALLLTDCDIAGSFSGSRLLPQQRSRECSGADGGEADECTEAGRISRHLDLGLWPHLLIPHSTDESSTPAFVGGAGSSHHRRTHRGTGSGTARCPLSTTAPVLNVSIEGPGSFHLVTLPFLEPCRHWQLISKRGKQGWRRPVASQGL